MDPAAHIAHLRRELDAFAAALDGDLTAPVAHCGDWALHDLAGHLGGGNHWAAGAVTAGHGRTARPDAPADAALVRGWFEDSGAVLLAALDRDPQAPAWTFHPPRTVAFWCRRRAQETLVHRWDAQHALGAATPLDPGLSADGVAEVFDTMAPRQTARGRLGPAAHAIRLRAADTGDTWTYGPGEPVAELAGTAEELLLTLWGRRPGTPPSWTGDAAAGAAVLAGPLTP